jgi:hypothetical protein
MMDHDSFHEHAMEPEPQIHDSLDEPSGGNDRESAPLLLPKELLAEVDALATGEEKLERIVVFMQRALEGGGGYHIREFWEARRLCLKLFQLPIHPTVRVHLWARYSELCREARRLKDLFEEQSSFVAEQIDMAIDAIEEEFASLPEKLTQLPDVAAFQSCTSIHQNLTQYQALHHELSYLNSFASRMASLRKEILKTDMRHKHKTRLLERLWAIGDSVYPRRKADIRKVSELFMADVEAFIQKTFVSELSVHELLEAREEIKRLQGVEKLLTLSTEVFSKTRPQLSECWDSVKTVLKERKQAQAEQRQTFRHNRDTLMADLDALYAGVDNGSLKSVDVYRQLKQMIAHMRSLPLSHQDVRLLREKIKELEARVEQNKVEEKAQPQIHQGSRKESQELHTRVKALQEGAEDIQAREEAYFSLVRDADLVAMSKAERLSLDRSLGAIRGVIEQQHAERLSGELTDDEMVEEREALERLRDDIKYQLERWRKASGSSCDFSEALQYTDCIEEERRRLERIEEFIARLEGNAFPLSDEASES